MTSVDHGEAQEAGQTEAGRQAGRQAAGLLLATVMTELDGTAGFGHGLKIISILWSWPAWSLQDPPVGCLD